jgi:hypothetical protein
VCVYVFVRAFMCVYVCVCVYVQIAFGEKADDVELQQQHMRARYEASKTSVMKTLRGNKNANKKRV